MRYNFLGTPTPATPETTAAPPVAAVPAPAVSVTATIKVATHTKRQCPIWIVQLNTRVARAEYLRLNKLAKKHDGYYSSYGPMDMHGFIFFTEANAQTFTQHIGPVASAPAAPVPPAPVVAAPIAPSNIIQFPKPVIAAEPAQWPVVAPKPAMPAWRARLLRRPLSV